MYHKARCYLNSKYSNVKSEVFLNIAVGKNYKDISQKERKRKKGKNKQREERKRGGGKEKGKGKGDKGENSQMPLIILIQWVCCGAQKCVFSVSTPDIYRSFYNMRKLLNSYNGL